MLRLCGTTRYTVHLEDFEQFLGEEYDFEKHLRTIHDNGVLSFGVPKIGDYYDSPEYRRAFAKANGLIRDCERNISFVAFYVRDDGKAQTMFEEVLKNAKEIGLDVKSPFEKEDIDERKQRLLKTLDEAIGRGDVDVMKRVENAAKVPRWYDDKQYADKDCS